MGFGNCTTDGAIRFGNQERLHTKNATDAGSLQGRDIALTSQRSPHIHFQRIFLAKEQDATRDLRGSVALTEDTKHVGWLHIVIFVCQWLNAFFTGQDRKNINLVHGQVILDINQEEGKKGQLLLAHSICPGIKTSSENHQKDKGITGVVIYRPIDNRIRDLLAKFAEQTAVNFKKEGLDPKAKDFKTKVKKIAGSFSVWDGIATIFHRQVLRPHENVQKELAFVAADLLKGDKLRNAQGRLAAYYCTSYTLALIQGTALVAALSDQEQIILKEQSREEIAHQLLKRIQIAEKGDAIAATYWNNDFMRCDARHTMSYKAGDLLDKASDGTPGHFKNPGLLSS